VHEQLQVALKDKFSLKEAIVFMEEENSKLMGEGEMYRDRIAELERSVLESENNLSVTQSSLNKLKQTIK
jgi:regulator of replication initiation timing